MNPDQLTAKFEELSASLKAFVFRLTASEEDAEDILQDTFIKATQALDSLHQEQSLKSWLFSIACNLAKDNLRAKKRWPENINDICKSEALSDPTYFAEIGRIMQTSQYAVFEIKEHIAFCLACISKSLPLEQQICVLLKEMNHFKVAEIAEIMDTSTAMVKYYLHTARTKLTDIFEGRCALINKNGTCHQCSELNGIFNPKQNFEIEKNKIELARHAENPDRQALLDLRLKIVSEIDPFYSPGSDLQLHHIQYNRGVMEKFSEKTED